MSQDLNIPPPGNYNPLTAWYRQPKIYVKLPSGGRFYSEGSLDRSDNDEYPVYSMTAKDELMFKTPDALLTGQSTVEVIKSCFPAIVDPWKMPAIDLDFVLISIRVATYGEMMEIETTCPSCSAKNNYDINLTDWMQLFNVFTYDEVINADPLIVHIRPYSYKELTKTSLRALEQQRVFNVVNDDTLSDEDKLQMFGKSFVKLTELTVDIIADCITKIETPNGPTSDTTQIKDFINNCPKGLFQTIQDHISNLKEQIELKVHQVKCNECEHVFEVPVTMDQSNFFNVKS